MSVVDDLLSYARQEIGTKENPAGSNKTKYGEWYGWNGVAWCAMFLSYLCAKAGIKWRFASTVSAMHNAKKNGLWSTTPQVGWAAMRQYTRTTGHIGVVEAVHSDGTVTTTEGNTNLAGSREGDGVYRKRRRANWWSGYINLPALAFNRPEKTTTQPTNEKDFRRKVMDKPTLREGSTGHDVYLMQALLTVHAGAHAGDKNKFIDGNFGPSTARVLREWQGRTGKLAADGICGGATWAFLVGV